MNRKKEKRGKRGGGKKKKQRKQKQKKCQSDPTESIAFSSIYAIYSIILW
jgi:hypothetical protein